MYLVSWSCPWWGQSWEQGGAAGAREVETRCSQTSWERKERKIQETGRREGASKIHNLNEDKWFNHKRHYFELKVRQAIREKYGIQKPIRDDDDYEIEDDDSIRMNNNRTGIT